MVHTLSSKFKKVNETYNSKQDSIESCFFEYLMIKSNHNKRNKWGRNEIWVK